MKDGEFLKLVKLDESALEYIQVYNDFISKFESKPVNNMVNFRKKNILIK